MRPHSILLPSVAGVWLLLSVGAGPLVAQTRAEQAAADARSQFPRVQLTAGRSTFVTTDIDITRIAITNPAIANAVAVSAREILIDGKAPGTVSLIVWGNASRLKYDLVVEQPVTALEQHLRTLFPGEDMLDE